MRSGLTLDELELDDTQAHFRACWTVRPGLPCAGRQWPDRAKARHGSKEVLIGEVCQAPTGHRLRCNNHPDFVDPLLPG
jgi:hypothetical protein